jgi:hypothetical protein
MEALSATKRLFHAVVVLGMASYSIGTLGCSGDTASKTDAGNDGAAAQDGAYAMDAAADAFPAWLGC